MEWSSVDERDLTLEEAKRADEVFVTSSMRDVQAVERWDDRVLEPMEPVTQVLAINFAQRSKTSLDPVDVVSSSGARPGITATPHGACCPP